MLEKGEEASRRFEALCGWEFAMFPWWQEPLDTLGDRVGSITWCREGGSQGPVAKRCRQISRDLVSSRWCASGRRGRGVESAGSELGLGTV